MTRGLTSALALALAVLLMLAAGAAAHDATIANGGEISMVSSGRATFISGQQTECNFTLSGSFSRSITNLEAPAEQEVARISSVAWRECVGGELESVLGTPWTFAYTGETGSMPNEVSSIQMTLHRFQYLLSTFGGFARCLYAGDLPFSIATVRTRVAGVYTTGLMRTTEAPLSLVSGFGCPERETMTGSFGLSPTQTITIS